MTTIATSPAVGERPPTVEPGAVGRPIYIGGLDRSGKTTMAAFLTSHPNVAIPGVGSNMWTYFYGRFGDLAKPENLDRCLRAMLRYSHVRFLDPDHDRILREFPEGPPTYARLFSLFLIHYAEARGKPRWGVQTGLIERYIDHVFRAEPEAKVIHMVRDPRDRYEASLALWPDGKGRAGAAAARWRYSLQLGERHVRAYPGRYTVVRYEDLVLRTEETLRRVCGFLEEPFVPDMIGMPGAPERRQRLIARAGLKTEGRLLSPGFIGRFRERVPPMELAFLQLHLRRLMRAYHYEPEPLSLSPGERTRFALVEWPGHGARMLAWRVIEALQQRFPRWLGRHPDARTPEEPRTGASR
jgi:hypothetical protein